MILVDTSVWIDHFREPLDELVSMMISRQVVMHEFVIGELAAGNLADRQRTLAGLGIIPHIPASSHFDVLAMVEFHRLHGQGLSWIDLHLLAAAKIARVKLWTTDARLARAAASSGLAP